MDGSDTQEQPTQVAPGLTDPQTGQPLIASPPSVEVRVAKLEGQVDNLNSAVAILNESVGKVAPAGAPIPSTDDPTSAEAPAVVDPAPAQHPNDLWAALEPGIKWGIENGQIDKGALPQEVQDLLTSGDLPPAQ